MNEKVTIAIDRKHDKILEKLCKIHKCTKKDFVCSAIIFFDKNNISPIDESPEQINKLHKKLDNVIAFIRSQEKNILIPTLQSLTDNSQILISDSQKQTRAINSLIAVVNQLIDK